MLRRTSILAALLAFLSIAAALVSWVALHPSAPDRNDFAGRGQGVLAVLQSYTQGKDDRAAVASTVIADYEEARRAATLWSFAYWGCVFFAAGLSAAAGLVLKLESLISSDKVKKDVATTFAVVSALLITLSSSGQFDAKWRANRLAAAELERVGYTLATAGQEPNKYYQAISEIQYRRQLSIIGKSGNNAPN